MMKCRRVKNVKEVEPGLSSSQIIDRACFSPQGLLRDEFGKLYASLFDDADQHVKIVRTLAKSRGGVTRSQLLDATGLPSGGTVTKRLDELEESGFIQRYIPFGKREKDALCRLSDEFSFFYISWMQSLGRQSPGSGYWLNHSQSPRWRAWSGYAFEGVCIKHAKQLKAALGIAGVSTTEAPWRYCPSRTSEESGTQIDLLIDRSDNTINLCEMKFSDSEFMIKKKYAVDLREKKGIFQRVTKTRKNVFLTMVTTFGLIDNTYAKELVSKSLTIDALF